MSIFENMKIYRGAGRKSWCKHNLLQINEPVEAQKLRQVKKPNSEKTENTVLGVNVWCLGGGGGGGCF